MFSHFSFDSFLRNLKNKKSKETDQKEDEKDCILFSSICIYLMYLIYHLSIVLVFRMIYISYL